MKTPGHALVHRRHSLLFHFLCDICNALNGNSRSTTNTEPSTLVQFYEETDTETFPGGGACFHSGIYKLKLCVTPVPSLPLVYASHASFSSVLSPPFPLFICLLRPPFLPPFLILNPAIGGMGSAVSSPSGVCSKAPAANAFLITLTPEHV